jgi:phage gp29-like protein
LRNLQQNSQSGFVLPSAYDPDTKQPLFELSLLSMDGKKAFDIDKIKAYYKNAIFTSLQCDLLILGQGNTGSFALAQFKNSVTASAAEALAKMICEVINRDLIKQTYDLNGWDTSRMCSIDFDGLDTVDLETFSKAVQRMGATGYLPKSIDVVNTVLNSLGIDQLPEGTEIEDVLPEATTRSGEGMEQGLNSGTGNAVSENNASDMNADNAA